MQFNKMVTGVCLAALSTATISSLGASLPLVPALIVRDGQAHTGGALQHDFAAANAGAKHHASHGRRPAHTHHKRRQGLVKLAKRCRNSATATGCHGGHVRTRIAAPSVSPSPSLSIAADNATETGKGNAMASTTGTGAADPAPTTAPTDDECDATEDTSDSAATSDTTNTATDADADATATATSDGDTTETASPTDAPPAPPATPATEASADAAPTADTGSAKAARGSYSGRATYYATGLGACGVVNTDSDAIVALASGLYDSLGTSNSMSKCGQSLTISWNGKTAKAKAMDRCPGCDGGSLDLSPSLFQQFAPLDVGVLDGITWTWDA